MKFMIATVYKLDALEIARAKKNRKTLLNEQI